MQARTRWVGSKVALGMALALVFGLGLATPNTANAQDPPEVLISTVDGSTLADLNFYSLITSSGWDGITNTCLDVVIEDPSDPCNPDKNFGGMYFGNAGDGCGGGADPCNYVGLPGGSAFTTAIDMRDFASGTPITMYPTYAIQTDAGGGDVFELWARVNLEGEVFQKIASNNPLDTSVPTLFDFGTQTVEPILLPSNTAGNFLNIEFRFAPDGAGDNSLGVYFSLLEFVGTNAAAGSGTTPDPDDDTTAEGSGAFTILGSNTEWSQVGASDVPLSSGQTGFYFGDTGTGTYTAAQTGEDLFSGLVDLTGLDDTVTLRMTYAIQTDDPTDDVMTVGILVGNSTTFTTLASSDPGATGVATLQTDGVLRVVDLTLPAGAGGNFASLRIRITTDGDATTGQGFFVRPSFTVSGPAASSSGSGSGSSGGGGGGGGGACFIATAAYGTPVSKDIDALRDVRDTYLMNNALGLAFVDTYYRVSPVIADAVAQHPALASVVRVVLTPVVFASNLLLKSPGMAAALVLMALAAVALRRRQAMQH